jgi:ribosomal protein S18 acetylase RimI-like enzyme
MSNEPSTSSLTIYLAALEDLPKIEHLDSLSDSPTRDIHREIEKYFGSIDPSTHERTFIFLAELENITVGKVELMVPPGDTVSSIGYIKRVIVHPDFRGRSISRQLMQHVVQFAHTKLLLSALDLHVWENNAAAIHLYETLGFALQHRELYYRMSF